MLTDHFLTYLILFHYILLFLLKIKNFIYNNIFYRVADKADKNLMTIGNLGVCFGPTLLRPEEETVASIMDLKFYNVVVEILIENFEKIFKSKPENHHSSIETPQSSEMNSVSQSSNSIGNNHTRCSTPPNIRHIAVTHPQPRYPNYHAAQPVTYAVTKTYCDGPTPVNMSSSLHNVTSMHDRETNGGSVYNVMTRSDHSSSGLTSPHGSHQHLTSNHARGSMLPRIGPISITTHSEGNLLNMHNYHHNKFKQPMLAERCK